MGWFSKLFGTDKAVNSLVDKDNGLLTQVGGWIGNFNYTDEEKAENNLLVKQWGLKQLEALEPFKVVQRILAFGATFFWIFVGINVVVSIWVKAATNGSIDVVEPMMNFALSDYVWWPVAIVYGLYFAGGTINSMKAK
jgi:hypothetical protein